MRRGELLGLRWADVDLEGASVDVRQNLVVDHRMTLSDPKTAAGRRPLAVDPETVAALRAHLARQSTERLAWGPAWQDSDLVFTREDGAPFHPERITKTFDRHRTAAKLPVATFHGLRHTHATALLRAAVQVRVVSQRLGHASVTVTLPIYSQVLPGDDAAAALAGAALLGPAVGN